MRIARLKLLVITLTLGVSLMDAPRVHADFLVASPGTNSVLRYDQTTGTFLGTFVAPESGGLSNPANLTIGPGGDLFVVSAGTGSILRFSGTTGASLGTFASGGLAMPVDLVFGPGGDLFVTSAGTNSVLRYNGTTGAFLGTFVTPGSGGLSGPVGLVFIAAVPEPSSLALLVIGIVGALGSARRLR